MFNQLATAITLIRPATAPIPPASVSAGKSSRRRTATPAATDTTAIPIAGPASATCLAPKVTTARRPTAIVLAS